MLATKVQHLVSIYSRVHKTYQVTNITMLSRKIELNGKHLNHTLNDLHLNHTKLNVFGEI